MELGIISLSDIQTDPATGRPFPYGRRLDEIISYATLADRRGLDVFALGEHHTLDFAVSSPAVVLAAMASRTSHIRLTSGVTVLPVLDAVRVYQDFATLDLVSHGRAEITVGRSAFTEPFGIFGADLRDYDALFSEKLDLLLQLRGNGHVTWSGNVPATAGQCPDHPSRSPGTAAGLARSRWLTRERRTRLAASACRWCSATSAARYSTPAEPWTSTTRRVTGPADAEELRVGISTHFYAGATPQAARKVFPYYHEYLRPKTPGGRGFLVSQDQFDAGTRRGNAIMIGSSAQLIEKILDAHQVLGLDRFFGQIDWGGLPKALVEDSINRYATEIGPAVRAAVTSGAG